MTPVLLTWTVWLCAGLSPLWPWTVKGHYTGSPAVRFSKYEYSTVAKLLELMIHDPSPVPIFSRLSLPVLVAIPRVSQRHTVLN